MPFDSNGNFSLTSGYLGVTGQTILTSQHNPPLEDIAAGMSTTLLRTGVAPMVANLQMGGYKVTNMGAGVASTDAATVGQTTALAVAAITGAALKGVPADLDTFPLVDSAAGNSLKRITWSAMKLLLQPFSAVLTALSGIGTAALGDIIYGSGVGTWARLPKGTAAQSLLMNAGATSPVWATVPFTKSFESAQQTITPGGTLTVPHGLGAAPKLYMPFLQCTSAELGYSLNDELSIAPNLVTENGSNSRGVIIVPDGTNLNVTFGTSTMVVIRKTTGSYSTITNASWRLVLRAWA